MLSRQESLQTILADLDSFRLRSIAKYSGVIDDYHRILRENSGIRNKQLEPEEVESGGETKVMTQSVSDRVNNTFLEI